MKNVGRLGSYEKGKQLLSLGSGELIKAVMEKLWKYVEIKTVV